ncbi:clathrin heavy chain linker domain-containing protein 1-like [Orbicella faveolata]|uniref:clathrin heavy chain linker domain-containing protein 1-like n=1 Tax=Orbicella faveolata TaxID=48498 RepID=UPI0009E1CCB9|nr:clathrin heavy chain linker domain-containing protein 1-like [Orbicella faveolata]
MDTKMAVYSNQLQDFLNKELLNLDSSVKTTKQDHYCVHKVCFERLIDEHSTYRDLLSRIKVEYEECIEAMERGQREAVYLSGKLAAAVLEPETIRMVKKRADELELKVGLLKIINHRRKSYGLERCQEYHPNRTGPAIAIQPAVYHQIQFPVNLVKRKGLQINPLRSRHSFMSLLFFYRQFLLYTSHSCYLWLPGSFLLFDQSNHPSRSNFMPSLTLEQLTDTAFLTKKLADLKSKVTQVKHENETRFVPKETKGQLFNRLQEREVVKEALLTKREELKMKIVATKLSLAVWENIRKPSLKAQSSIVGKIAVALRETNRTMEKADEISEEKTEELQPDRKEKQYAYTEEEGNQRSALSSRMIAEDDDPTKDREAEFILEYIENFFELFEAGKVEDAALLAAHSPKGVLRTMENLEKFKEYDAAHSGSCVLAKYWEALLATVATGCMKPSKWETIECVKCVLEKGRKDLLTHWMAQDQLTLSEEVGRLITDACRCPESCKCGLIGLAEVVFANVGASKEVLACFLRQGRFLRAMDFSKTSNTLTRTGES